MATLCLCQLLPVERGRNENPECEIFQINQYSIQVLKPTEFSVYLVLSYINEEIGVGTGTAYQRQEVSRNKENTSKLRCK